MTDNVRLSFSHLNNCLFSIKRLSVLAFIVFVVVLIPDTGWAGRKKRLKHRHSLMIGAGFFGDPYHFGSEGLCFHYQYDLNDNFSIFANPVIAFPNEENLYYMQFLPGINWRPFGALSPRKRDRFLRSSPYVALVAGIDYFWTDPVANNIETRHRFGLMPFMGLGYTMLFFSHFLCDIHAGVGYSWAISSAYGHTFAVQQHVRVSFGMKF